MVWGGRRHRGGRRSRGGGGRRAQVDGRPVEGAEASAPLARWQRCGGGVEDAVAGGRAARQWRRWACGLLQVPSEAARRSGLGEQDRRRKDDEQELVPRPPRTVPSRPTERAEERGER
ncbi:hypothetical protein OsI_19453 [Oryza sativa Indica Group]|uniref:Uncharacterized protein n=1 Tax=Oryza sativa subsp. indica TaxID=39946 RepID=B8AWL2_ORYSI|nr:hypothetical protein OsI_19453 [Oryza sativa Indica Group]